MEQNSDIILNHSQIKTKITRLAWQVYENNMDESLIWIAGIDKRGMFVAGQVAKELSRISDKQVYTMHVQPGAEGAKPEFVSDFPLDQLENAAVVLADDVLNTGKTIVNAMLPLLERKVRKIQVLVLASRSHRLFPLKPDFVGISMASTLQEHLDFDNSDENNLRLILT